MSASLAWVTGLSASVGAEAAVAGELQRLVERTPGKPERRRADRHSEQVQGLHADPKAFARLADDRIGRQPDIVVFEPPKRVRSDDLDPLLDD